MELGMWGVSCVIEQLNSFSRGTSLHEIELAVYVTNKRLKIEL
jgi:hypothetical protein